MRSKVFISEGEIEIQLEEVQKWANKQKDGEYILDIKPYFKNRSNQENRYYWKIVVKTLADELGYTGDEMHDILREMFMDMEHRVKEHVVKHIFRVQAFAEEEEREMRRRRKTQQQIQEQRHTPVERKERKVGRNESCPCGSGKKYKKCCGK